MDVLLPSCHIRETAPGMASLVALCPLGGATCGGLLEGKAAAGVAPCARCERTVNV